MSKLLYTTNSFVSYNYPLEEANVVFVGIPFSSTSVSCSSQFGPVIVRESMRLTEDYDKKTNKNLFKELKVCDIGNLEVVPGSYHLTAERIKETIKEIQDESKAFLISVGGEHLITLPIAEALKPKTVIQLDAHRDLRKDYLGKKFSHTTWAYHLLQSLNCNLVQIGVREVSKDEEELANKLDIKDEIKNLKEPIYLTIDIDVFDPCYVKTGLPVSNGLKPRDVFDIIEKLRGKKLVGMDITEIADNSLPSNTGFLCAEIVKRVLGLMV